jgi:putative FmdB family regulatory protein
VATYRYRCAVCGPFDLARPMGQAAAAEVCTACGGPARRVFTVPGLPRTPRPLARALAAQEASAHEPQIVQRVPPARRAPTSPPDPRHARLPRP